MQSFFPSISMSRTEGKQSDIGSGHRSSWKQSLIQYPERRNANEKSNGSNNQNEPLNIQEMMTSTNKSKYYHFSQLNFSNIESYIKYLLIFVEVNENRKNNQLKWYPKDVNTAKAIAYFNLSVAHAVRSEIDIAFKNFNMVMFLFLKNIHLNN